MKKSYIIFTSLFVLMMFAPNFIRANIAWKYESNRSEYKSRKEGHKYWKKSIEDTLCLLEKKSNLKEYKGPNLKFGPICRNSYSYVYDSIPVTFPRLEYLTDVLLENKDLRDMIPGYKEDRHFSGYISAGATSHMHVTKHKTLPKKHIVRSVICGCNDYIYIHFGQGTTEYGYDVTDVPIGSYLKFIPETKELQVISPKDGAYEEIIKNQKELSDLAYYNSYFGNLHGNQPEVVLLKKETYKDFVENAQSKVQNEELKSELKKYAAKLKREILKNRIKEIFASIQDWFRHNRLVPTLIYLLIITFILKGILSFPFGKKFGYLVCGITLITNPLSNLLLFSSLLRESYAPMHMKFILVVSLVIIVEWLVYLIIIRKKCLKLFLFALLSNVLVYGFCYALIYSSTQGGFFHI